MDVDAVIGIITFLAFFLVFMVALPVALSMRRNRLERDRWAVLLTGARQLGLTVTSNPRADWAAQLPGRDIRGVSVVVSGVVDGWPVAVADYSHTISSTVMVGNTMTPTSETREYVAYVVWVPPRMRHLSIAVEDRSGMSRLGRRVFGDSATATGNEAFDRRFKIWAQPPESAQRLIGRELVAEHLAGHLPTWNLHNGTLVTYHPGRLQDPRALVAMTAPLVRVATLLGR